MVRANRSQPIRQQRRLSADGGTAAPDTAPEAASRQLLSVKQAAHRLGIRPATLYDWLGQSDHGVLIIRGHAVTIKYYQSGPRGQGRIRVPEVEVERLLALMRVVPSPSLPRPSPSPAQIFNHIHVPLGRPSE